MARYDRIARMPLPERSATFAAWPAVADLAADERDPELGRRARLRFLALRPVLRMLRHEWDVVPQASLLAQVGAVREELGQLGTRDPERRRLGELLSAVAGSRRKETAAAAIALGRNARDCGHAFAAEEFYRAGFRIAVGGGLHSEAFAALHALGDLAFAEGRPGEARAWYGKAVEQAAETGSARDGAAAVTQLARVLRTDGDADQARSILIEMLETVAGDDGATGTVASALCALELDAGSVEAALEHGWTAVSRLAVGDGGRRDALRRMAAAFRGLGLTDAAAHCDALTTPGDASPDAAASTPVGVGTPGAVARTIAARVRQLPLPPSSD